MSIFGIIGLSFSIAAIVACFCGFIASMNDWEWDYDCDRKYLIAMTIIVAVVFVACIFIFIGTNTEDAKIWSANFEAQKITIEQSLESDVLSGLERIELVNKAAELNGELAERQAKADLWHVVYYADDVYEGLEPIGMK